MKTYNIIPITFQNENILLKLIEHNEKLIYKNELNVDFFISQITLNEYYKISDTEKNQFINFINENINNEIPIYFLNKGDFAYRIPKEINFKNIIVLSSAGNNKIINYKAFPSLWYDPIGKYINQSEYYLRKKTAIPVVGFCGHGNNTLLQYIYRFIKLQIFNFKATFRISNHHPESLLPGVFYREKILKILSKSNLIIKNFIISNKYKAGVNSNNTEEVGKIRKIFYLNILNSDYTLCVRGGGNFSIRFYETLAMGRIPIVYDTNQLFPYKNQLNFENIGLFIDSNKYKIKEIPYLIKKYHDNLSEEKFIEIQKKNREIWIKYMTEEGVSNNFDKLL
jgi:hypothetical protein